MASGLSEGRATTCHAARNDDGVFAQVVVLEAWDYGGQEVFYALHHLFLTRFGVYCVLFNMEWLASTATDDQRAQCLAFLRFCTVFPCLEWGQNAMSLERFEA